MSDNTETGTAGRVERYGIFLSASVERDEDGFIEVPVIIEESGLFFGAPPAELRIHEVADPSDTEFARRYVAKLNRRTDLPFYLATAKIKVVGKLEEVTDAMIRGEGLEPLRD